MEWERYRLATKQAQWILDLKLDAGTGAHWAHHLHSRWVKWRPLHKSLRSHGRRAIEVVSEQPVYVEDLAGVIAVASAPSVARREEWEAVEEFFQSVEQLLGEIPLLLDALCPACVTKIGDSGITTVGGDPEEARALEEIRHLITRFSMQGPAQRRKFLHMLHVIGEAGVTTTFSLSESGELSCSQGGLSTRVVLKEAA